MNPKRNYYGAWPFQGTVSSNTSCPNQIKEICAAKVSGVGSDSAIYNDSDVMAFMRRRSIALSCIVSTTIATITLRSSEPSLTTRL